MSIKITDEMVEAAMDWTDPDIGVTVSRPGVSIWGTYEGIIRAVLPLIEQAVREQVAQQAAIRSAALFEAAWDEGNAMGLDGWTGPGRGAEPDQHAIDRREKTVDRLVDKLAAHVAEVEKRAAINALREAAEDWTIWEVFTASDGTVGLRGHGLRPEEWLDKRADEMEAK